MVKTQIFICCDKCEKPLNDIDQVYGYAKIHDANIAIENKDYTDFYFDSDCYESIRNTMVEQLKKSLLAGIKNSAKSVNFSIPYIGEVFTFYKLDFDEVSADFFYVQVDDYRQLVKLYRKDNSVNYVCIEGAVDLMLRNVELGRLMDLRRKFKEDSNARKLASQCVHSLASAVECCRDVETTLWN